MPSKGYWRLSLEGPLNGGTPSSALPPGGLGHAGEPERGPGTKPKGVCGEAYQVGSAAERSQAHSGDMRPLRRRQKSRGAAGAQEAHLPQAAAPPPPCSCRGLCCVFTGEFLNPSGPSVLCCETGMLTKASFGEWMDT